MKRLLKLFFVCLLISSGSVFAYGTVQIELNKLDDKNGSCRAFLVFKNQSTSLFKEFKLDLVMFGSDGIINRRLAVDASPLRPDKTTVKLFDIDNLACQDIGLILINDVLSCSDESTSREDCVTLIEPSSRNTDVSFVK